MIVYNFLKKSPIDLKGTTYPYITVENNANWHQPSGENHEVDVELIDEFPTPRIERTCQKVALKNKMKICNTFRSSHKKHLLQFVPRKHKN